MPEFRTHNSKRLVSKKKTKKVPRRVFATLQENEYMFATKKENIHDSTSSSSAKNENT